ncbi:WecB/TagA/CpsF family glycosyltransferase [Mucilaginibacter lacusdianchii]|uniref:WecB/TagA/CpsF family glycosyltransferase n=1 Tax=Mucilaginibacter lacusdianchii TaxID=2684211 RepID=UPI00131AAA11|nr:WecB/TagA/CpsF family glycosyltransferase [Mucilaginibacter sp. JXJ CY 39]
MIQYQQPYSFIDYPLFTDTLDELNTSSNGNAPQSSILVNTINQYSYCVANEDAAFKESLQHSDILLPDGVAVVAAARLLTGKKIKKIAGADLHQYLLTDLNNKNGSCFYLGASDETLAKIKSRMAFEYPNVKVETYSPPYKKDFSTEDNQKMVEAVNAFKPDVVFVGMTAPKQEKWAYEHKTKLDTKIICTIGAVFDFYAGTVQRPGDVYVNLGLEWFGRLVKEPKRLWKRYLYFGPVFVGLMLKEKVKKTFSRAQSLDKVLV